MKTHDEKFGQMTVKILMILIVGLIFINCASPEDRNGQGGPGSEDKPAEKPTLPTEYQQGVLMRSMKSIGRLTALIEKSNESDPVNETDAVVIAIKGAMSVANCLKNKTETELANGTLVFSATVDGAECPVKLNVSRTLRRPTFPGSTDPITSRDMTLTATLELRSPSLVTLAGLSSMTLNGKGLYKNNNPQVENIRVEYKGQIISPDDGTTRITVLKTDNLSVGNSEAISIRKDQSFSFENIKEGKDKPQVFGSTFVDMTIVSNSGIQRTTTVNGLPADENYYNEYISLMENFLFEYQSN